MIRTSFLSILLLAVCGCAPTILMFKGTMIKEQNAIVIASLDADLGASASFQVIEEDKAFGRSFFNLVVQPDRKPVVLEVPAGKLTIGRVQNPYGMGYIPLFAPVELQPGKINYLGTIRLNFDYANSKGNTSILDTEKVSISQVKQMFPDMFEKYGYVKNVIQTMYDNYGDVSELKDTQIPMPNTQEALLAIYRPNGGEGEWVTAGIFVDETRIVGLELENYTWVKVKPGKHKLTGKTGIWQNTTAVQDVYLEPGQAYFYKFEPGYRRLVRVPIAEGLATIKNEKYEYDESSYVIAL